MARNRSSLAMPVESSAAGRVWRDADLVGSPISAYSRPAFAPSKLEALVDCQAIQPSRKTCPAGVLPYVAIRLEKHLLQDIGRILRANHAMG
jgi:hypothetical protein